MRLLHGCVRPGVGGFVFFVFVCVCVVPAAARYRQVPKASASSCMDHHGPVPIRAVTAPQKAPRLILV
jgi:hypothetical protein